MMLIKDIKFRRVRKLAKKLAKKKTGVCQSMYNMDPKALDKAFYWDHNGCHEFWDCINKSEYEAAYAMWPHLFKPTKKEIKEAYAIQDNLNNRANCPMLEGFAA